MEKPKMIQDSFFCGGMSQEKIDELVGLLEYKYPIGIRVLVHEQSGYFWAKVVEQTYGFWGASSNMLRPEYIIEPEKISRLCRYPENWLKNEKEISDIRIKIVRLKEKAKTQEDNDVKEALNFYADQMMDSLWTINDKM